MLWAARTIRKTVRTIMIISKSVIASPPFLLWIRGVTLSAGAKRPTTAYRLLVKLNNILTYITYFEKKRKGF